MRLLLDYNMRTITAITTNSENSLFPAANLKELDPAVIWKATAFNTAVSIAIDFGKAVTVDKIWLNNANFLTATIQANSSNSWSSPAVNKNVVLVSDDIGIVKGYFNLSTSAYRYVRVLIPLQTLESGNRPTLGNIIIGKDIDFSPVSKFETNISHDYYSFVSDGGSFFKTPKTKARHVFEVAMEHITKSELKAIPLNHWQNAIIFTDMADVSDSYLVYPPASRKNEILSSIDCSIDFKLEELV